MKHFFKKYERMFSPYHYVSFLKRQPKHLQHFYALFFAGAITSLLGMVILYVDYGFWHDTYSKREDDALVVRNKEDGVTKKEGYTTSPFSMIADFAKEAEKKFSIIDFSQKNVLEGKAVYRRSTTTQDTQSDPQGEPSLDGVGN